MAGPTKDLVGLQYGMLTVVGYASKVGVYHYWNCRCACGTIKAMRVAGLRDRKSCGCIGRFNTARTQTHGMSDSVAYQRWRGMKSRATSTTSPRAADYALRGINVDSSGRIGVSKCPSTGKWRARLKSNSSDIWLGRFNDFGAACTAIEAAELRVLGYSRKEGFIK